MMLVVYIKIGNFFQDRNQFCFEKFVELDAPSIFIESSFFNQLT